MKKMKEEMTELETKLNENYSQLVQLFLTQPLTNQCSAHGGDKAPLDTMNPMDSTLFQSFFEKYSSTTVSEVNEGKEDSISLSMSPSEYSKFCQLVHGLKAKISPISDNKRVNEGSDQPSKRFQLSDTDEKSVHFSSKRLEPGNEPSAKNSNEKPEFVIPVICFNSNEQSSK